MLVGSGSPVYRVSRSDPSLPAGCSHESLRAADEYACPTARRDELSESVDAALCADGAVKSVVDPASLPGHRRGPERAEADPAGEPGAVASSVLSGRGELPAVALRGSGR
jgi:hypothetical protein